MNLEKFCIVKRRKQGLEDPFPSLLPIREEKPDFWQNTPSPTQEINSKEEPVLSLNLTPMQGRAIRSGGILPILDTETPKTFNIDLHHEEDGSIIFNFHLHDFMMLNPLQVCQMMQISRSLLNRMILEKRIKSYKIGRLRRFFLNDIIENLSESRLEKPVNVNFEVAQQEVAQQIQIDL
jgi:excisionase family DNA binding protein